MKLPEARAVAPAAVRQPTLRGHQLVAALWFPAEWFDEFERARRVLAHWRAGATALRFAQGDLLRFASAFEHECDTLGGWPLCKRGGALCSAPLIDAEAASMPAADVWIVQGGQVTALEFREGRALDPAEWLEIGGLALHDTYDCRAVLPEPIALAPADVRDLREVLNGRVPPTSEEQREFLRAMAAQQRPGMGGGKAPASRHGLLPSFRAGLKPTVVVAVVLVITAVMLMSGSGFNLFALLGGLGLAYLVRRFIGAGTRWISAGESPSRPQPGPTPAQGIPARNQRSAKPQAWRQWLARLAVTSQVSRLLGRRQAAYMRKMMELFEEGKLDEALRHAIPLGSNQDSLGQAFGTPGARDDLSLRRQRGSLVSIHLGEGLDAYLRRLYRETFEKLDREGRIDEAVFVLAELLQARQEALDYLEKHTRFQQAAELALAWDQPADVIVRLHCLAGDWRRAVAVARRDNAFASTVLQLEKKWPDTAAKLREEWAQALAAQGDWLRAVEAIWPLAARRELATGWLLSAEATGGALGARALVKRAMLLPDTLVDCATRLEDLRDDPACHLERAAIAEALLAQKERHPRAIQLARIVAPALLADQGAARGRLARNDLQRLITLAGDPWLTADIPGGGLPNTSTQDLTLGTTPLQGQLPEAGSLVILDAVALHDGQHLIALGEAGAVIADAHGKIVARFAVPAQRIVIAHSRQVALVMALRDRVWRVSRLDLANRRVGDLGMAELEYVATEFDGIAWTVAGGTRLRVLDTQHSLHEVLWQVADLPGQVRSVSANARVEQVVVHGDHGAPELWRYLLPQRRLLARGEAVPERVSEDSVQLLNPNGGVIDVWHATDERGSASICYRLHNRNFSIPWPHVTAEGMPLEAQVAGAWLFVGLGDEASIHWCAIALATGRVHANIDWPAAARPRVRLADGCCVVFDTQGRLWSLNTTTSEMKGLSLT
jgi:hypothetical protein